MKKWKVIYDMPHVIDTVCGSDTTNLADALKIAEDIYFEWIQAFWTEHDPRNIDSATLDDWNTMINDFCAWATNGSCDEYVQDWVLGAMGWTEFETVDDLRDSLTPGF